MKGFLCEKSWQEKVIEQRENEKYYLVHDLEIENGYWQEYLEVNFQV
ncbi:hypothetical protein Amet_4001 [Alkaliphilus metalliredigens QYMF]|uniref:Uncharacterized protein n=1 Tax=Alkaliphilus metalliredigens (strain QYMF) TaxID=293826 RepID=A6TV65_ALKMQ|nr:hypothetical protein Amet_4001 [Alkaliphilus metalliredigens QYMF]